MRVTTLVVAALACSVIVGCAKKEETKAEAPSAPAAQQQQPVAGATVAVLGVTVDEVAVVAGGWSVKKQILGQSVTNDKGETVGTIDDIIIAPDKAVSYAIIGAGGFLGMDRHDVAIPANQFKLQNGKLVLPGATKDAIKAMPPFVYAGSK